MAALSSVVPSAASVPEATQDMCAWCFQLLEHHFSDPSTSNDHISLRTSSPPTSTSHQHMPDTPLFVTWDKRSRSSPSDYTLRGCIGTLSPAPMPSSLKKYCFISALQDTRFSPIVVSELPHLRVSVSLLVAYEACSSCYEWEVGRHGIIIKFSVADGAPSSSKASSRQGGGGGVGGGGGTSIYSATYLPNVAQEQGWSREEAVSSLIRKSGFKGCIDEPLLTSIQTTRYQSSKATMNYDEYVIWGRTGA